MIRLLLTLWLLSTSLNAAMLGNAGWDYEARKWQTNIVTVSGTLSGASYQNGTQFMQSVKRWGLRQVLGRVNLYLGGDTNAMLCPIIRDWWDGADLNDSLIAFTSGDYAESSGLTGDGSTKFLSPNAGSGVNPSTHTDINSIHFAVYNRSPTNEQSICMGQNTAGSNQEVKISSFSGNSNVEFTVGTDGVAETNGIGFYLMTRTSSSFRATYKNGTNLVSSTTCSGSLANGAVAVHACNNVGTICCYTSRTLSYYSMGLGVSPTLAVNCNIAVQNVQRLAGRQVQ